MATLSPDPSVRPFATPGRPGHGDAARWQLSGAEALPDPPGAPNLCATLAQGTELLRAGEAAPAIFIVSSGECVMRGPVVGLKDPASAPGGAGGAR